MACVGRSSGVPAGEQDLYESDVMFCSTSATARAPGTPTPSRPVLYVSTSGSDAAAGTLAAPFRTLTHAGARAKPGATVFVRGGTYAMANQQIVANGTDAAPITFSPYNGETVRLSGAGLPLTASQSIVTLTGSSYVIFEGMEVMSSAARGVDVYNSHDVTVQGCTIHDTQSRALGGEGDNLTFDGNEIYNAVMNNTNGAQQVAGSGWSAAVGMWLKPDGTRPQNLILRNNHVHDSWGECVIPLFAKGVTISGNRIHDCWSTNLYLDNVQNVTVDHNYLYATTDRYNRPSMNARATGLMLALEPYSGLAPVPVDAVTLTNNLVVGTGKGIAFWADTANPSSQNSYRNVRVEFNVVANTSSTALAMDAVVAGAVAPSGNSIRNNIVYAGSASGAAVTLGNGSAWTVSNNVFPSGLPGSASASTNLVADPKFVSPVVGGAAEGYKLQAASPCLSKGLATGVSTDYFGNARNATHPSIGIYE